MHLVPVTPPAHVQMLSGFDYVTTDAQRRRIYAAHTGSGALLVVNADTGQPIGQVEVGPMHGLVVDEETGHVFTGDGEARTVSEVDPQSMKVLRSADVDGNVDAIAYDAAAHRVYADEDDGTHMFVVDTVAMKEIASIPIPGHKPEYPALDAEHHVLYQNIDNLHEVAVIDTDALKVVRTIPTDAIEHNHPLQYDPAYHVLLVGGKNSTLAAYSPDGKLLGTATIQATVDQCDLDKSSHTIACAGSGKVTVLRVSPSGALTQVADLAVSQDAHTVAIDPKTGDVWIVWSDDSGDYVQALTLSP